MVSKDTIKYELFSHLNIHLFMGLSLTDTWNQEQLCSLEVKILYTKFTFKITEFLYFAHIWYSRS
jgi:hypothetical protein